MDINIVAVVLAALAAFFLGFFWYTIFFAKIWQKEIGLKLEPGENAMPTGLGKLLAGSFILELIMATGLAVFIGNAADIDAGVIKGAAVGVAVALGFGVNYLFEGKSMTHWLINAGYNVVVFAIMGMIIGVL
jgi:hypothetical protein